MAFIVIKSSLQTFKLHLFQPEGPIGMFYEVLGNSAAPTVLIINMVKLDMCSVTLRSDE